MDSSKRKPAHAKHVYTTTEVARICGVSTRTVQNWIDAGLLQGWKIPGGRERRVNQEPLDAFLAKHKIAKPKGMEA